MIEGRRSVASIAERKVVIGAMIVPSNWDSITS
jgi:hypothetical protein